MKYAKPEVTRINSAMKAIQNPAGSKKGGAADGLPIGNSQVTVNAYPADE